jgi:16S rRNA pseudouridine516 synthase
MRLLQALYSQGFGTKKTCEGLIKSGLVKVNGQICVDPFEEILTSSLVLSIHGEDWPFKPLAYVALHKPADYECSRQPQRYPSVLSLLPQPLQIRNLQPVGRLDADTTGLLLLTDDGALLHKLTSPKHHIPKVYEVACKHPLSDEQIHQLLSGVYLRDEPQPVHAQFISRVTPYTIHLTLTQGKYHQVKRMVAAVGNRVESLHRVQIGQFQLPPDLKPGQWIWIDDPATIHIY